MSIYARVYGGVVVEIIQPATYPADSLPGITPSWKSGDEIPVAIRYTPEFVATLVDITSASPQPACGWSYDGTKFTAPTGG